VFSATPAELQTWCRSGEVIDCKTLVGALWLQNVLRGDWVLDWGHATPAHMGTASAGSFAP
jgi:ADP-ribose pyrophosphatase